MDGFRKNDRRLSRRQRFARRRVSPIRARRNFMKWFHRYNPRVARAVQARLRTKGLNGLHGWLDDIISTVKEVAPSLVQAKSQRDILKTQMKRAEQGLPPLKTESIAPTVKVQADITPEAKQEIMVTAKETMNKVFMPLALGLGGLALFAWSKKGRRKS